MLEDDQMDESGNIHTMKNDVEVVGGERDVEVGKKILVNEDRWLSSREREGRRVHRDWQKGRGCRGKEKKRGGRDIQEDNIMDGRDEREGQDFAMPST